MTTRLDALRRFAHVVIIGLLALHGCAPSAADRGSPASGKGPNTMTDPHAPTPALTLKQIADLSGLSGTALAFDRAGKRWALGDDRTIQLGHDAALDRKLTAGDAVYQLAFSADGKHLFASPEIYDLARDAWQPLPSLAQALAGGLAEPPPADQLGVVAATFAADGKDLVLSVRFQPTRELGHVDDYHGPGERLLLVGADRALRAALYEGDRELRAHAVSDRLIAAGGKVVQVWDRQSLRKVAELKHNLGAYALAFNPAGDRLAVITAGGEVSIWDPAAGTRLASFTAHQGDGYAIAFHPTLPIIATGGQDGKLKLWSLTGQAIHEEPLGGWVRAVAFDAAGTRLGAATWDRPPHLHIYAVSP